MLFKRRHGECHQLGELPLADQIYTPEEHLTGQHPNQVYAEKKGITVSTIGDTCKECGQQHDPSVGLEVTLDYKGHCEMCQEESEQLELF